MLLRLFNRHNHVLGISLLLTIALSFTLLSFSTLQAYDKKVLVEDFTSSTCGPCSQTSGVLEEALEATEDICVPIAYHMRWPGPGTDPWYHDNEDDNGYPGEGGRADAYGVTGIPDYYFNGEKYGGSKTNLNTLVRNIENATEGGSPLFIEISGQEDEGTMTLNVSVTSDEDISDVILHTAIVEEFYFYEGGTTDQTDFYDAMVKMVPDYGGTDFDIEADETLEWELEQDMEGLGWHDLEIGNLILLAWVQTSDTSHYVLQAESFSMKWTLAEIEYTGFYIDDSQGNGDGRAEAGESVDFIVEVTNTEGFATAETVDISLTCDDFDITIGRGELQLTDVEGGTSVDNSDAPFTFTVSEDFETHPVTFIVTINAEPGEVKIVQEMTFMINWPEFLVIDASNDILGDTAMFSPWGLDDLPYADRIDYYADGIPDVSLISHYPTMIVHSMNNEESTFFSDGGIDMISYYLDTGGRVILNSPVFCADTTYKDLMQEYFGAEPENNFTGSYMAHAYEGDHPFADEFIICSGNGSHDWPYLSPSISALEGARELFYWSNNDGDDLGACVIENINLSYRTLLISIPLETIGDQDGGLTREVFFEEMLTWLDYTPQEDAVDTEETPLVIEFGLNAAYPNPFNAQTVIPFNLDRRSQVSVTLHDLSGREISRLFNGSLDAGSHNLLLDAGSVGLSSGTYYVKLMEGERSLTQPVTFMK
ncbi:T9SS type A sorting domain-containing protein [Calditrichota bacterium]